MLWVVGVNWIEHARKLMEAMISPNLIYELPAQRLYGLFFFDLSSGQSTYEIKTPEDYERVKADIERKRKVKRGS